ncbi:hypothetical protein WK91_18335 [Burkholderia cepacia]|uniref:hypothetical protein n=1 Tax=Burkholderia cepacia TaxID=292 RepID=UPI00075E7699|nr:hypothetical protein [Burkholderia cepacia]KVW15396.1 hypothetical protein WK91_18335 [Burkholderia cepacia]
MTIVAWDGKTVAADRMIVDGYAKLPGTKIHRINGELFGCSGCWATGMTRFEWARAGMNPATYPVVPDDQFGRLLRITADGEILLYTVNGLPMRYESPFYAIGSGSEFAMAAMYLGHSAEQAVHVACELSNECGMGIDKLEL